MANNPEREQAEAKLKSAQQRLQQQDNAENRKAVEDAQRELDNIDSGGKSA